MTEMSKKFSDIKKWWKDKIEQGFYDLGFLVSGNPWKTIIITCFLTFLSGFGLNSFYNEKDLLQLYVPRKNRFYSDTEYLVKNYKVFEREQGILLEASDVLTYEVLRDALMIHNEVMDIRTNSVNNETNIGFKDLCYRIPIISSLGFDSIDSEEECESVTHNTTQFCGILKKLPRDCLQDSILELFKFDLKNIPRNKTEILELLNQATVSPYSGITKDFRKFLGGIEVDSNGTIISAKSIVNYYRIYGNYSDVKIADSQQGLGSWASENMLKWEKEFLQLMEEISSMHDKSIKIYYQANRSYGDKTLAVAFEELDKYILGSVLMFFFMQLVLSKFQWTEIRVILGSIGLFSVVMGFISGCGICSMLKIPFGPIHAALPFLLLGLGVDDMFVLMSVFRDLPSHIREGQPRESIGLMMQKAGASITITSLTDIVAFIVGGLAAMPILQSFCLFAAVSIFCVYFYVITFYVAIFTLDQRRVAQRRNGLVPCIVHKPEQLNIWCEKNLMYRTLKVVFSKFILTKHGKITIIALTAAITACNIYGLMHLKFRFDPTHHVPENTYLSQYMHQIGKFYPEDGCEAAVLIGHINYTFEMKKLIDLSEELKKQTHILHHVDAWPLEFKKFIEVHYENKDVNHLSDYEWRLFLQQFLSCHVGGKYTQYFKFEDDLICGKPTPTVTVSQIAFKFKNLKTPEEYLPAKQLLMELVEKSNLNSGDGFSSVWGKRLMMWIPDEIVKNEIFRNITLALVGVIMCTSIMIANFNVCFWIFVMVVLTLVNVAGAMYWLGLILDMVTYIALQLSIGLCVDYAAHIGHMFLTIQSGSRDAKALKTVLNIGAAVIYGGGSTFLALSVLSVAKTYSYRAFFKVNALIIMFGLYNGVVVLPVILSFLGPSENIINSSSTINNSNVNNNQDSSTNNDESQEKMLKNNQMKL